MQVEVVATQLSAPVPGGTGRYTAELLRALSCTRPSDGSVRALVAGGSGGLAAAVQLGVPGAGDGGDPVDIRSLRLPFRALARLWERGLPPRVGSSPGSGQAVLHAPTLMVPPVRAHVPLVVTVHDVVPWTHPETLTPRGVAFHRRMGEVVATRADLVVTPTQVVAEAVRRHLQPRAEVRAIPPPVSPLVLPDPRTEAAVLARLDLGAPYLLFVGTAEPRKGLEVLVRALSLAPDLPCLVVVGPPGWGGVDVADLARRNGVARRVRVLGRVEDDVLAVLYARCAVLAVPSLAEGFGLPLLEGMRLGAPAVTSDDPALAEVGAGAASIVPVGDAGALARALTQASAPSARPGLQEAGRARAAAYDWKAAGTALWGAYEEAAAGRRQRTRTTAPGVG